jgi:hypothetical protein
MSNKNEKNSLINTKIGKWTVISKADKPKNVHTPAIYYNCICDCGTNQIIRKSSLSDGHSRSCGCLRLEEEESFRLNIIGQKINQLVVLSLQDTRQRGSDIHYNCLCDCGKLSVVQRNNLLSGHTKTCGCLTYIADTVEKSFKQWMIGQYIKSARSKKREFLLKEEEFFKIIQEPCEYCGFEGKDLTIAWRSYKTQKGKLRKSIPETFKLKSKWYEYSFIGNGIDRIDSSKGYIQGNCVSCCTLCNRMKMEHSLEIFFNQIRKIYDKHLKNN